MKNTDWYTLLKQNLGQDYLNEVDAFVQAVYSGNINIYPPKEKLFAAMELTSLAHTKVIIVGQDPYPQPNKAQGLSFSYPKEFVVKRADSMSNILKELQDEEFLKQDTDLTNWAKQGVLLLNAVLSVPEHQANAHAGKIWEPLTDEMIKIASADEQPKVFILWGNFARKKAKFIDSTKHLVIESAHPSPLSASRGFFGSKPFSKANEFLKQNGQSIINWEE
ncbi:MAG: uracil-DNA glycosylase [Streptococcaceae bacterium]|jgi:uracil-DNA glycosylase|nr:uracil-DNA glycosylase [Streptococcaceae bacterium]